MAFTDKPEKVKIDIQKHSSERRELYISLEWSQWIYILNGLKTKGLNNDTDYHC